MSNIVLEGDMYGILYELKRGFDALDIEESFQDYSKREIDKLYKKGIEMLADDERLSFEQNGD